MKSKQLLEDIRKGNIRPAKKQVLDKWVSDNCSEDGKLKGA
jgi:muramidase (phage lysozyme)